jgi:ACS family hexuronate transporter-like MFS transporter
MTTPAVLVPPRDRPKAAGLPRLRWVMIGLAFLATIVNYLDRQTLSVVAPTLRAEFHMSNEAYGYVLSAFLFAYAVFNGLGGPLIDRLGTKRGYGLSMAWWSTAGILHAFAVGPWSLAACRFLLGVGEAGNWPAGVKVVTEWFPARERALAAGIFNSGAAIGAVMAPPLVTWLVLRYGWQRAFLLVGLTGYVWLAFWWYLYRTPAHLAAEVARRPAPAWRLMRTRFVSVFTLVKVFVDPVWYFYIFWFPQYLSAVYHFDLAAIGMTAWIPFVTADIGNLVGGWFSGYLLGRGFSTTVARKTAVAISCVLMMSAIPAIMTTNVWLSIACISTATFGYTSYNANGIVFPAEVVPKNMVASAYGLASMGSGFGGMLFSWLSGRLIDRYGYTPVFIGYGIMPLIVLLLVVFAMGPLTPARGFEREMEQAAEAE